MEMPQIQTYRQFNKMLDRAGELLSDIWVKASDIDDATQKDILAISEQLDVLHNRHISNLLAGELMYIAKQKTQTS